MYCTTDRLFIPNNNSTSMLLFNHSKGCPDEKAVSYLHLSSFQFSWKNFDLYYKLCIVHIIIIYAKLLKFLERNKKVIYVNV